MALNGYGGWVATRHSSNQYASGTKGTMFAGIPGYSNKR